MPRELCKSFAISSTSNSHKLAEANKQRYVYRKINTLPLGSDSPSLRLLGETHASIDAIRHTDNLSKINRKS